MKKFLSVVLLLVMAWGFQPAVAQDIIMGSAPLVNDIEDSPRYFYDPGGVGNYTPEQSVTMTLQTASANMQLYALFEEFVIGNCDTLWIYDGNSANAPLLGAYSLMNSPGEVLASGRALTFVFHSHSGSIPDLRDGWKAQVYAYDPDPLEINYGEWISVLTCNANFYDAGGPNGNIGTAVPNNNFTEFTSPSGKHVKCEFTQFSVDGLMKIYDGQYNDPNKRLIGQFCTSTLDASTNNIPPVLFSTTNTLCFVYECVSGDVNKPGWKANISCVPELLEYDEQIIFPGITNTPFGDYADAPNPHVIELDTLHPMVMFRADIPVFGTNANDYKVEQIPYDENNMLFAYNQGNSISATQDDQWMAGVDLPFEFVFFGQPYTKVYPGTNGLISMSFQSGNCVYHYNTPSNTPPYSSTPYVYKNCVYGVYEDIDCRYYTDKNDGFGMGAVRVGVLGQYPSRAFVFNYLNVGLFGLTTNATGNQFENYNTYQMVLYEGTNIIDVYVKHRKCCASTNGSGEGIIGLQNNTSSQILFAPGRGMTGWSADNEAWRFTPITPPAEYGELTWYKDTVDEEHILSYSPTAKNRTIVVYPIETASYISEYRYVDITGNMMEFRDTTLVLVPEPEPIDSTGIAVRNADFTVWPNPTHDAVYVKLQSTHEMPSAIEVLDLNGRLLFTVPAQETTRVDLSRLSSGFYLLRAAGGKGAAVKIAKR